MKQTQLEKEILIYTRKPKNDYTESLSNSIHFAYCDTPGSGFTPLNRNYGILFTKGTVDENNVIHEKGLKSPYLFHTQSGSFGIIAGRVAQDGKEDTESKGQILLWTTEDLIDFQDLGLINLGENAFVKNAVCEYRVELRKYVIQWQDSEGRCYRNTLASLSDPSSISLPEQTEEFSFHQPEVSLTDIEQGNILQVEKSIGEAFYSYWSPLYNIDIHVPDRINLSSHKQLQELKATAIYSDGSTAERRVIWNSDEIDFSVPGVYTVKGRVEPERFPFPLATGYADPVILPYNNKYYYIATNDNENDIGIYVREADTIQELFAPGFKESLILDLQEENGFVQTFWAPEFHWINEDLYILFAVSGKVWGPQCHIMKWKKGGNILSSADWETAIRIRKKDGSYLTEEGITLDMTYFKADGISYVAWSYRKDIGTPYDTGSMIYIATVDESNPTILTSEPVLLSRPLYGWENIQGTINNEGPYPLITDDTIYITFSGGAANGYTYALGLLSISRGSNLLDATAWRKSSTPVLSYYSADGVYGPGHNSFFRDFDGNTLIMYHGEMELVPLGTRCSAMHRMHFNQKGVPVFDLIGESALNTTLADVVTEIIVS